MKAFQAAVDLSAKFLDKLGLRYLAVRPVQKNLGDAINAFKLNPSSCFYNNNAPVDWSRFLKHSPFGAGLYASYVSVESCGIKLGYITRITASNRGLQVKIGHFAVVPGCVRTGVATAMAQALGMNLRKHYKTETIIFDEEHSNFDNHNYRFFFLKIGATNPDPKFPKRWEWNISKVLI